MKKSRKVTILVWLPRILLTLNFIGTGLAKLTAQPMTITEFDAIGFGQGFRVITGVIEVAAALLLIWPRTMVLGALVMLGVLAGAFVAQLGPLHGDVIHVIVIAAVVLLTLWLRRWSATLPTPDAEPAPGVGTAPLP